MLASRLSLAALAILLVSAPSAFAAPNGVSWRHDLDAAKLSAAQSGKLVLVHFWTPTCGPCKVLDTNVFNQPTVGMVLEQNFVPVKINADEAPEIAESFGISRVPFDIVISPSGEVLQQFVSPATPMAYMGAMTQVVADFSASRTHGYETALAAAPQQSQLPQNAGFLGNQNSTSGLPHYSAPTANASTTAGANVAQLDPAGQPITRTPALPGGKIENPWMNATDSATSPPLAPGQSPTVAMSPGAAVGGPTGPFPPSAESNPAGGAVVDSQQAGTPPLGFYGYCTVSMREQQKWVKGDARWGVVHRGHLYLFAGQEQRDSFWTNPDQYSPMLSGADPVVALEQQKLVPGLREYAIEYGDRFYLFSSEDTLAKFQQNAAAYAKGVYQAMAPGGGANLR